MGITLGASADRLFLIPLGKKIHSGGFKFETAHFGGSDRSYSWLTYGVDEYFEVSLTRQAIGSTAQGSFDIAYNQVSPFIEITPGFSAGIIDVLGVTETGRVGYLAITFEYANYGEWNQELPTEFTLGFWTKEEGLLFAGARLPFSRYLWLFGEHDSERFTAGVEVWPVPEARVRFAFTGNGEPGFSFTLQKRF